MTAISLGLEVLVITGSSLAGPHSCPQGGYVVYGLAGELLLEVQLLIKAGIA